VSGYYGLMSLSARMPDLAALEVLLAIARTGSLSAAGREIGLTQQAVSARVTSIGSTDRGQVGHSHKAWLDTNAGRGWSPPNGQTDCLSGPPSRRRVRHATCRQP